MDSTDGVEKAIDKFMAQVEKRLKKDAKALGRVLETTPQGNVVDFPGQFPKALALQGHQAPLDEAQLIILCKLLRAHRGIIGMEARQLSERTRHLVKMAQRCDDLIEPLEQKIKGEYHIWRD